MWAFYNKLLQRYPIPTEMTTSAFLWFSGDVFCQHWERRYLDQPTQEIDGHHHSKHKQTTQGDTNTLDWKRVWIQTIYGGAIWGPIGHYWYKWLDRAAHSIAPPKAGKVRFVGAKLALEIVLLHPVALCGFFTVTGLMGGDSPKVIMQQLRHDYLPSLLLECTLWTPVEAVNFFFVPVKHQLLLVNTFCFFESAMLSYIKANGVSLTCFRDRDKVD